MDRKAGISNPRLCIPPNAPILLEQGLAVSSSSAIGRYGGQVGGFFRIPDLSTNVQPLRG